ncbi:Fic family protein [Secundilactobacillus oryzae]|uniref:Fic family protein n=1 Tax=Secundilactobacillus oryzae TaxID=1202668 RepID=UPI0006D16653|nr:Fic family protein [Secundilactobacillus oryzae]
MHPTVVDKATHLWYSIATKQLFHNGNKRTALLSGITLLNLNFIDLPNVGAKELYNISLKLAEKEMSEVQLKQYILAHAVLSTKFMNLYLDQFSYVNESRGND